MENASKALIIAGSVLFAVMVIGLVTMMWSQISSIYQTTQDSDDAEALATYNNRFEQYARTLYGNELISLANLQADYGERKSDLLRYEEISITVQVKTAVSVTIDSTTTKYLQTGEYNVANIKSGIEKLESAISSCGNTTYKSKNEGTHSVEYWSDCSYWEIAEAFGISYSSDYSSYEMKDLLEDTSTTKNLMEDIDSYEKLTSAYTTFKNTKFTCDSVTYGDTGIVSTMTYTES